MPPTAKPYGMTKGKTNVITAYKKKIKAFLKPYGVSVKDMNALIKKEFEGVLTRVDKLRKPTLKDFKKMASELYDDMVEMEEAEYEEDDEER